MRCGAVTFYTLLGRSGRDIKHLPADHGELGVQSFDRALNGRSRIRGDLEIDLGLGGVRGAVTDVLERDRGCGSGGYPRHKPDSGKQRRQSEMAFGLSRQCTLLAAVAIG